MFLLLYFLVKCDPIIDYAKVLFGLSVVIELEKQFIRPIMVIQRSGFRRQDLSKPVTLIFIAVCYPIKIKRIIFSG